MGKYRAMGRFFLTLWFNYQEKNSMVCIWNDGKFWGNIFDTFREFCKVRSFSGIKKNERDFR